MGPDMDAQDRARYIARSMPTYLRTIEDRVNECMEAATDNAGRFATALNLAAELNGAVVVTRGTAEDKARAQRLTTLALTNQANLNERKAYGDRWVTEMKQAYDVVCPAGWI